ncbi:MAG: NADP-dependent oxidoreductase [Alphaproteobacteria bacterium]
MRAVLFDDYGGPEVLRLDTTVDPVAGPGEILVDIHAASVNAADSKVRAGPRPGESRLDLPHVLGRDFSGVVRSLGEGVGDFAPGDAVFGVTERGIEGCYAEAIAVPAALAAHKPDTMSHVEAAALSLTGLTALVALEDEAKLGAGQRILIHGGAGGVGSFAVQYARFVDAHVMVTGRAVNHDYLRDLGADEVIDYTQQDFAQAVSDCDVVFDTIGGEVHARSYPVLKPGGRLIHIAPPPKDFKPPRDDVTVTRPHVGRDRAHLERVLELVAEGAVKPPQIQTLPLEKAPQAHELSQAGHVRGKIVFQVRV